MIEYNVLIKWGKYEKTVKQETNRVFAKQPPSVKHKIII